jgi:hypothetical protein
MAHDSQLYRILATQLFHGTVNKSVLLPFSIFFFRKGAAPASASIDAYGHFYYFIKEFYNVIQIMDHKESPQKSARQK